MNDDVIAVLEDGMPTVNGEVPRLSMSRIYRDDSGEWVCTVIAENYAGRVIMQPDWSATLTVQ